MKVVLFACIEKNIGDDLFIYTVCKRYPKTNFVISSEANYGDLSNLPNLSFDDNLRKWIRFSDPYGRSLVKRIVCWFFAKYNGIKFGKHDIGVYIVGNSFKNMNYTGKTQSLWLKNRITLVNKFFLLSTNFGPFNNKLWVEDCKRIFSGMYDICFRDDYSASIFKDLDNTRYCCDAIFSLGKKKGRKEKRVIISLIDGKTNGRPIELQDNCESFENTIALISKQFMKENYQIVYLLSNSEQDRPSYERIKNMIGEDNSTCFSYDGDISSVFKLFSDAEICISTRLHPIELGLLYGLKVIPIIYDEKVSNMLDSINFTGDRYYYSDIKREDVKEIMRSIESYSFEIDDAIITNANNQFIMLDEVLLDGNKCK